MFFRKEKIKFHNQIVGVNESMPIIPTSQISFDWKQKSAKDYNKIKETELAPRSASRCLGINLMQKQGWVIRTYQDIFLEILPQGIKWQTPFDQKAFTGLDYVSFHDPNHFKHMKNWSPDMVIAKVNTGWLCEIPKGYLLYQTPIFYSGEDRFETSTGCYSYENGIAILNVPMVWNLKYKKEMIPAGTPIAQLFLAPEKDYECEIGEIDEKKVGLSRLLIENKFTKDYKTLKSFFK